MTSSFASWWQILLDFIYPARCAACGRFVGDDRFVVFCRTCWESIPRITSPVCPRCGTPFPSQTLRHVSPTFICGACRSTPPNFDRAFSATYYEGVAKAAVHQLKFYQKTALGKLLAHILLAQIPETLRLASYSQILPVPLHRRHQRRRGYNQSEILAYYLAQNYRLRMVVDNLIRVREIKMQSQVKGRQARRDNVKNAFCVRCPEAIRNQRIILVDDVFTTGATVNECSNVLKRAGAASVLVLTFSRVHFGEHREPGK